MEFTIHTDGSSSPKRQHGMGGWGFVVTSTQTELKITHSGYEISTTNQRMEMMAIIESLKCMLRMVGDNPKNVRVSIVTDSRYCLDGITDWIHGWKFKGWKKSGGPIKNLDLWQEMYTLVYKSGLKCRFSWVKGHSGHPLNELADQLANKGKQSGINDLEKGLINVE